MKPNAPEMIVAVYVGLKEAQDAMYDLEEAGIPYPDIRLNGHSADDLDHPQIENAALPDLYWSLSITLRDYDSERVTAILHEYQPLAIGRERAPLFGRDDVARGDLAWGHFVFDPPGVTPSLPESIGNSGTTGTISTGAFADGAKVERDPLSED